PLVEARRQRGEPTIQRPVLLGDEIDARRIEEPRIQDIMQTCRSGPDGVARWVLQRFFARGVKASLRGATAELQRVGRRPAREPRAREGDRPLVRGPPTMGEAGISAHISPCVSPPPGQAQSLRQAADAWHGVTGIGETSTWRKREAARWITTVDPEARRFGLRSSVSATAPRRWCRGSSSTAPPPKTGSSPV